MIERACYLIDSLIVLRACASAEAHCKLAIPSCARRPSGGLRFRIIEYGYAIDAAIYRPRFDAHNIGNTLSVIGRRVDQV